MHLGKETVFLPLILLAFGQGCDCAKILAFILQCSYSQLNVLHPYAAGLAGAGHEVTLILPTPFKKPDPKITYIVPDKVNERWTEFNSIGTRVYDIRETEIARRKDNAMTIDWVNLPNSGVEFCQIFFHSSNITNWMESSTFDLVIIDGLWNDCGLGLAHKFKAPFIYFETTTVIQHWYDTFGVLPENSWIPDLRKMAWGNDLTFLQRLENEWLTLEIHFLYKKFNGYWTRLEEVFRQNSIVEANKKLDLEAYQREASLVLVNTHFSTEVARSLPPLFVLIGGIQCGDEKVTQELPVDISKFIQKFAGFFYVSFGTFVQLPLRKQMIFVEVFKSLPETGFIMKWCGEMPKEVPQNVYLLDYAPQQAILAHKKILGFVSHGGMLSTNEVITFGVPVIAIPVFAEQDYNSETLRRLGAAIKLEIVTLTAQELHSAFGELRSNPQYKKAMMRIRKLSLDRPQHPLATAVWWTEYVLRHAGDEGGLDHLKPLGIQQYWFQRRAGDIWAFLTLSVILGLYITLKMLVFACKLALSAKRTEESGKRKAKKLKLR